jgi:hypothetical protein
LNVHSTCKRSQDLWLNSKFSEDVKPILASNPTALSGQPPFLPDDFTAPPVINGIIEILDFGFEEPHPRYKVSGVGK